MPAPEIVALVALIIFFAYVVFGMSGFGSTLIAVPLLAHVLPLKFVIPMVVILDCIGAISLGIKLRAHVWKQEFMPMLPFLIVGLLLGAAVLLYLPTRWLLLGLGIFVVLFGANFVLNRKPLLRLPRWTVAPVGVLAGTTSSAFGVGGPIYVFYFTARGATPEQVRATVPAVFGFTTVARIVIFAVAGLFDSEILIASATLLPVMVIGMWCGHHLHLNMSRDQMIRVIGALLTLSGLSLLLRAAAGH